MHPLIENLQLHQRSGISLMCLSLLKATGYMDSLMSKQIWSLSNPSNVVTLLIDDSKLLCQGCLCSHLIDHFIKVSLAQRLKTIQLLLHSNVSLLLISESSIGSIVHLLSFFLLQHCYGSLLHQLWSLGEELSILVYHWRLIILGNR